MTRRWQLSCWTLLAATVSALPIQAAELPDLVPADTILYIGWPGIDALAEASSDTGLGKLMKEPEMIRFRDKLIPELMDFIRKQGSPDDRKGIEMLTEIGSTLWEHPFTLSLIGARLGDAGPIVDAALVVRAGRDSEKVLALIERALAEDLPVAQATDVQVGSGKLRELVITGPEMPLRWGRFGGDVVLSIGKAATEHLASGKPGLGGSSHFQSIMERFKNPPTSPTVFMNIKKVVEALESFQPLMVAFDLPVLSEPGGVQQMLDKLGLGTAESYLLSLTPTSGGFRVLAFLYAPGIGQGASKLLKQKPVTEDELKLVPRDASWASVTHFDAAEGFDLIMGAIKAMSPEVSGQVAQALGGLEQQLGMKLRDDLLGAFGGLWAMYDAPSTGGLLITGITLVADVKPGSGLEEKLPRLLRGLAVMAGGPEAVQIETETYRDTTISFLHVRTEFMPVVPAWAFHKNHVIFALYPQMVRVALDRMIDGGESILDNPDFVRGRKLMPDNPQSITYEDTRAGVRQFYSLLMPVGQVLIHVGRQQGMNIDASMLPSSHTLTKHLTGTVSVSVAREDGVLAISHGQLSGLNSMSASMLALSIGLPAVVEARHAAQKVVEQAEEMTTTDPEPAALGGPGRPSKERVTASAVSDAGPFVSQLALYKAHLGRYPRNLVELVESPENADDQQRWKGPYISDHSALVDPWGNEYRYRAPGRYNPQGYDLWSTGPDGEDGTEDDIRNWEQ